MAGFAQDGLHTGPVPLCPSRYCYAGAMAWHFDPTRNTEMLRQLARARLADLDRAALAASHRLHLPRRRRSRWQRAKRWLLALAGRRDTRMGLPRS
ncbi:MAG: hypothetical protein Kow0010_00040 [Dehalococcoidia bacterium]